MQVRGCLAVLALAALGSCCAPPLFRTVPLKFAHLTDPITEVTPTEGVATLVVARSAGFFDGGASQAVTVVLEDGAPLGQVNSHSFFVTRVRPGRHRIVFAVPEVYGLDSCIGVTSEFEAGKVYVVPVGTLLATDVHSVLKAGIQISKFSHFAVDQDAAKREVGARSAFWQGCVQKVGELEETVAKELKATGAPPAPGLHAFEKLELPGPP